MPTVRLGAATACLVALASCSTSQPNFGGQAVEDTQRGADPLEVAANFITASAEICGRYFENGLDMDRLASAAELGLSQLPVGSSYQGGIVTGMPVHRVDDGVVHIKENLLGASCQVSAYGIPVESTFDQTVSRLQKQSFIAEEVNAQPELVFFHHLTKTKGDLKVRATLNGNEPGAAGTLSRFSTLAVTLRFEPA